MYALPAARARPRSVPEGPSVLQGVRPDGPRCVLSLFTFKPEWLYALW